MVEGDLSEPAQEKIAEMMYTLNRLKRIVRSLLLISRIENDQFAKTDQAKVLNLLHEVTTELADRLEARKIRVSYSVSQGLTLTGINRDLIFQLIYNLVNNAIRYNQEGGEIEISDQYSKGKPYVLLIKDTGIGIDKNELETIFDRFKKTSKIEGEGYGLGLSIVKSIAQYHGIRIQVSSQPGKGSIFSMIFSSGIVLK